MAAPFFCALVRRLAKPLVANGGEGEIDSGHPGPRASRAVAKALRRPKSLPRFGRTHRSSTTHPAPAGKIAAPKTGPHFSSGGEGEIRTHEPRKGPPVFKTGAFNHCATSP